MQLIACYAMRRMQRILASLQRGDSCNETNTDSALRSSYVTLHQQGQLKARNSSLFIHRESKADAFPFNAAVHVSGADVANAISFATDDRTGKVQHR